MPKYDEKKPRRRLKEVELEEISFVGKGDNPEADIILLKTKKEVPEIVNKAISAFVSKQMRTFNEIISDRQTIDTLFEYQSAWNDSFYSILFDDDVVDKPEQIATVTEEFLTALSDIRKSYEENDMTVEELQTKVEELQKDIDDKVSKETELVKEIETLSKKIEELTKTEEKEITKEEIPEAIQKVLEERDILLKAQAAEIEKMKDEQLTSLYIAKAQDMNAIGNVEEIGSLLKSIAKADTNLAEKVESVFKTCHTKLTEGGLFKEMGASGSDTNAPEDLIKKKAEALMESDPTTYDTYAKAWTHVYKTNAELKKAFDSQK